MEFLAFINFNFEIQRITTKVITNSGVREEGRFSLNWEAYLSELDRIQTGHRSRPFLRKYQSPKPTPDILQDFLNFRDEFRQDLESVVQDQVIAAALWRKIFREAKRCTEALQPRPPVVGDVTEEELKGMTFDRSSTADDYRGLMYGQLRDLIVQKKIFRLKKCPECQEIFLDRTKGGHKVYCYSEFCVARARHRALRRVREDRNQARFGFSLNDEAKSNAWKSAASDEPEEV